jgi:hypothetical protein
VIVSFAANLRADSSVASVPAAPAPRRGGASHDGSPRVRRNRPARSVSAPTVTNNRGRIPNRRASPVEGRANRRYLVLLGRLRWLPPRRAGWCITASTNARETVRWRNYAGLKPHWRFGLFPGALRVSYTLGPQANQTRRGVSSAVAGRGPLGERVAPERGVCFSDGPAGLRAAAGKVRQNNRNWNPLWVASDGQVRTLHDHLQP